MTRDLKTNQTRANKLAMLRETEGIREIARNYAAALDAIRSDLARLYERYAENGKLTHAEMSKYNRLRSLERQLTETIRPVALKNNRLIEKISEVSYEESFYRHAWSLDQHIGVSLRWGLLSPDQVRAAVENPLRELAKRDLSQATLTRIRRAISQGLIRGTSLRGMMKDVREAMNTTANDAMRIVRTEAHRARELGSWDATKKAAEQGIELVKVWDATLDNRTRSNHGSMDGQRRKVVTENGAVNLERPFQSPSGAQAAYPGGFGVAREDINCRCDVVDEVEGFPPTIRRTREDGLQPYQTFSTWAQAHGVKASRYGERYNFVKAA